MGSPRSSDSVVADVAGAVGTRAKLDLRRQIDGKHDNEIGATDFALRSRPDVSERGHQEWSGRWTWSGSTFWDSESVSMGVLITETVCVWEHTKSRFAGCMAWVLESKTGS